MAVRVITTGKTEGDREFKASINEVMPGESIEDNIDLSALMKPRYKLEFDVGGVVVPFYFNKLDPGTMLMTHGTPLAVSSANRLQEKFKEAGLNPEDPEINESNVAVALELLNDDAAQSVMVDAADLKNRTLIKAVLSPKLTKELIEQLDEEIVDVLYETITGGITTDNKSVSDFPDATEAETV